MPTCFIFIYIYIRRSNCIFLYNICLCSLYCKSSYHYNMKIILHILLLRYLYTIHCLFLHIMLCIKYTAYFITSLFSQHAPAYFSSLLSTHFLHSIRRIFLQPTTYAAYATYFFNPLLTQYTPHISKTHCLRSIRRIFLKLTAYAAYAAYFFHSLFTKHTPHISSIHYSRNIRPIFLPFTIHETHAIYCFHSFSLHRNINIFQHFTENLGYCFQFFIIFYDFIKRFLLPV